LTIYKIYPKEKYKIYPKVKNYALAVRRFNLGFQKNVSRSFLNRDETSPPRRRLSLTSPSEICGLRSSWRRGNHDRRRLPRWISPKSPRIGHGSKKPLVVLLHKQYIVLTCRNLYNCITRYLIIGPRLKCNEFGKRPLFLKKNGI